VEESGSIYAEGRARLTDLVLAADPEGRTAPVPGCPEWAVKDVIAHVTGVCTDVLEGNLDGVTTAPWTAAQVAKRSDKSLAEILSEWAEVAPRWKPWLRSFRIGSTNSGCSTSRPTSTTSGARSDNRAHAMEQG